MPLKAYGHPGVTLYHATDDQPLCLTCTYHEDDTCTLPKRPNAMDCTLYSDRTRPPVTAPPRQSPPLSPVWIRRNAGLLVVLGLILLSLAIVLVR